MFKNVASQKFIVFAFDSTTNTPKTGDAANITAYVSKDFGAVTVLGDTSATEMDATNAKGYYLFDATQGETNADALCVTAKSSTANIVVVGAPATIFTFPATGILAPATAGRTLVVDASGLADANTVKLGPSGSGTAQTARDIGASVLLSTGTGTGQLDFTSGIVKAAVQSFAAGQGPRMRKNVAFTAFPFVMTDSTNHAPATGKTVTVTRSLDLGAFAAGTLGAVSEVGVGVYGCDFGAGDTNANAILFRATATGCDDRLILIITNP